MFSHTRRALWFLALLGGSLLIAYGCTGQSIPPASNIEADSSSQTGSRTPGDVSGNNQSPKTDATGSSNSNADGSGGADPEYMRQKDGQTDSPDRQSESTGDSSSSGDGDPESSSGSGSNSGENSNTQPEHPWGEYPQRVDSSSLTDPPSCSGTDRDWFAKYLKYRLRLRGDGTGKYPGFVSIGPNAGQSLPASNRRPGADCSNDWFIDQKECNIPNASDAHGVYSWGDSTITLGDYIAVLATEYRVFKKLGLDTSQTVHDLYYALEAFNRVDRAGEKFFSEPAVEDGFFMRSDIPGGFHKTPDGEYRFKRNDDYNGYACVSGSLSCGDPTLQSGKYPSQDQIVALTFGLAFVKKLIPKNLSYKGVKLRREARAMHHRMVNDLRKNNWKVIAPNGKQPPTRWGSNAVAMSNQLAKAANWIAGDEFGVDDYRTTKSRTAGASVFAGLDGSWGVQQRHNKTMASSIVSVTGSWNVDKHTRRTAQMAGYLWPYARAVLHDKEVGDKLSNWQIESTLTKAPCSGPCHNTEGCTEPYGWRIGNRWRGTDHRYGYRYHPKGEYNGLAYMLMHNVYFLYRNGDYRFADQPGAKKSCKSFNSLEKIVQNGPSSGTKYRTFDKCSRADMGRTFCGRPWSSWLKAAYEGKVTIWTGTKKWSCSGDDPCELEDGGSKGTKGQDLFIGTPGSDEFKSKRGNDCLYGFGGSDKLEGAQGYDEIHGGDGDDEIYGEGSGLVVDGEIDIMFGDAGDDTVKGRPGKDVHVGGPGDDELVGGSGNDFLEGEGGDDFMKGDAGTEIAHGGPGDDTIKGDSSTDWLWGGKGRDKLKGDSGGDHLRAGPGKDFVKGDSGGDDLRGELGKDRFCGNSGDDTLWAGWRSGDKCREGWGDDETKGECEEIGYFKCTTGAFNDW